MKRLVATALVFALLASSPAALADSAKPVVKADTKEAFDAIAASVRKDMDGDGRYAYVKPDERQKIEAGLVEIGALFDANGAVERMDKATKIKLFNAQEQVNAILTLRDRDRLICERGAATGSRIVSTTCRTYGELEAQRQASSKLMLEHAVTPCNAPSCEGK